MNRKFERKEKIERERDKERKKQLLLLDMRPDEEWEFMERKKETWIGILERRKERHGWEIFHLFSLTFLSSSFTSPFFFSLTFPFFFLHSWWKKTLGKPDCYFLSPITSHIFHFSHAIQFTVIKLTNDWKWMEEQVIEEDEKKGKKRGKERKEERKRKKRGRKIDEKMKV